MQWGGTKVEGDIGDFLKGGMMRQIYVPEVKSWPVSATQSSCRWNIGRMRSAELAWLSAFVSSAQSGSKVLPNDATTTKPLTSCCYKAGNHHSVRLCCPRRPEHQVACASRLWRLSGSDGCVTCTAAVLLTLAALGSHDRGRGSQGCWEADFQTPLCCVGYVIPAVLLDGFWSLGLYLKRKTAMQFIFYIVK